MENRIAELEKRVEKLEEIFKSIEFTGDGLNITFNQTPLYAVKISGGGANVNFDDCPVGNCLNGDADEIEDLEDIADELECRVDDIKCAAEDAKALLNDIESRFDAVSKKIKRAEG